MSKAYDDQFAKHCQSAIDLYKKFPDLGMPHPEFSRIKYYFFGENPKEAMAAARRKLACGTWDKHVTESYYYLRSRLADGTPVELIGERGEVCEQIVTGTKSENQESMGCPECEGKVGSDGEGGMVCLVNGRSDYYARPLKKLVKLVEVPKTEWVCGSALETSKAKAVTV